MRYAFTDRDVFDDAIGAASPRLSQFPNVVCLAKPPILRNISTIVGKKIGHWGQHPEFPPDLEAGGVAEDEFRAWGTAANQDWLHKAGGGSPLGHLSMCLPLKISDAVLNDLESDLDCGWFEGLWRAIAPRLEKIRWVYIPLSDEYPLAVFVTRPLNQSFATKLQARLEQARLPFSRIVADGSRDTWRLGDKLRIAAGLDGIAGSGAELRKMQ